MKRFIQVSLIFVVFVVLLSACSESKNQPNTGQANESVSEKAEESQEEDETVLPGNSEGTEGTTDDSESEDTQQSEPDSAVQEDGIIEDGKYINTQLGFSLNIPEHWMEHLVIGSGKWKEEVDHSIDFYYVAEGDVNEFLFSILVYDHVIEESQWQDPVWMYIGTANGKTYACAITGEPSETILEEKNKAHFEFVQKLINEELLDVLGTFQYIDS